MLNVTIRNEQVEDVESIASVTRDAFEHEAYSSQTEALIIHALRRANQLTVSLVAVLDDTVVGHIAFSPVRISSGAQNWYGLGPVSVQPALQGKGIGGQLICTGLSQLQAMGAHGCVVLGEPAFYRRFGFKPCADLRYDDAPAPYFQAQAFDGDIPSGQVSYHDAFAATQ